MFFFFYTSDKQIFGHFQEFVLILLLGCFCSEQVDDQEHSGKWILEKFQCLSFLQVMLYGAALERKGMTEMQASALCFHSEALLNSLQ